MTTVPLVLMDIEGTTTSISFVHETLFPYSKERMSDYVTKHFNDPELKEAFDLIRATLLEEEQVTTPDLATIIATLTRWIAEDRKHGGLKALQGKIWRTGYEQGDYQSHLYPDVLPNWQQWRERGYELGIYSSGSVGAQKLLFAHTPHGDLTPLLTCYFDTKVGAKQETQAYTNILQELGRSGEQVAFLSDVPAELDAAKTAGMHTAQLVRPGTSPSPDHPNHDSFDASSAWLEKLWQ